MEIIEFFKSDKKEHWLSELKKCDWGAGAFLYELITTNKTDKTLGQNTKVIMLTDENKLISFCTLAPYDDIQPTELTPWIGFVYTFAEYRGHRYVGNLIAYAENTATSNGYEYTYISTDHEGLYEKYGYEFYKLETAINGEASRVYRKKLK